MVYDPGVLHAALSAAVGDDPQLIAELRGVFVERAQTMIDQLRRSGCDADWRMAALRLEGLAASFGAVALMTAASQAAASSAGDPVMLRTIVQAFAAFDA